MSVAPTVFRLAKYLPVRLVESVPTTLLAGRTNIWEIPDPDPYLLWFISWSGGILAGLDPDVYPILTGEMAGRRTENRISFPGALQVPDDDIPWKVPFDNNALLQLVNPTVGAKANYQSRAIWEVHDYTVADKVALGVSEAAMNAEEIRLRDKFQILDKVKANELPMKRPEGQLLETFVGNYQIAAMAISEINLFDRTVPAGHKAILRLLWAQQPAANFGALTINVYIEKRLYLQIYPYSMANYATVGRYTPPLDLWIPAIENLRVTVQTTTGHVNVKTMVNMELRKMTLFDKVAWGLITNKRHTSDEDRAKIAEYDIEDKVKAGVFSLLYPLKA